MAHDTMNLGMRIASMIGGIKRIKVISGKEQEFEKLFHQLRTQVKKHELGNEYYDLYRLPQPGTYVVMERYRNQAAQDEHQHSKHGKELFPKIKALLEILEVDYYEGVE
jgi:quinol monooxygenase YgiN